MEAVHFCKSSVSVYRHAQYKYLDDCRKKATFIAYTCNNHDSFNHLSPVLKTRVVRKVKNIFPLQRYLLIIGKKQNMQFFLTHVHLLLHIVTLDTEALVLLWHRFTYSLLVPDGRLATQRAQILWYWKCSVVISHTTVRDTSGHCSYASLIVKCRFSRKPLASMCLWWQRVALISQRHEHLFAHS